jgi:hypothetical protein
MNTKLHLWSLAASVFSCRRRVRAGQSKTVAVVNGESITGGRGSEAAAPNLEKLDLKQKQFMATMERDRKGAVEDALEEIVNRKLLEAEAKKRSISVDDLLRQEVQDKVTAPSEEAVRKF